MSPKVLINIINTSLAVFIASVLMIDIARTEELFCKVYEETVLNVDGDGKTDTVIYSFGCTKIRPGQAIIRIDIDQISDSEFRDLFPSEKEITIRPLGTSSNQAKEATE